MNAVALRYGAPWILLLLCGCGPRASIVLDQPFAPPSQRTLKLASDQAFLADSADRQAAVAAFGLPGARDGPRAFVLYVALPPGSRDIAVAPFDEKAAGGFLIQEVGVLAGRSDFLAGTIRRRPVWFDRRLERLELDVRCEDGTHISGHAVVRRDARPVQSVEREFAGDVRLLRSADSEPDRSAATPLRSSPASQ